VTFPTTSTKQERSRYLFTITAINACLGLAVGIAVGLLGLRNPLMWGVMVALFNFVPYLGALTGIIWMTIGATLSFDSLGYASSFLPRISHLARWREVSSPHG
jgi:predicted PurR-regulated permease PerM